MFGILLCAFLGGSVSWLYLDQKCAKSSYFRTGKHLITNLIGGYPLPSLYEADIDSLAQGLERNDFTSLDLVKARHQGTFGKAIDILPNTIQQTYIARINEVNDILHAVTEVNPDALAIASALDKERSGGTVRG